MYEVSALLKSWHYYWCQQLGPSTSKIFCKNINIVSELKFDDYNNNNNTNGNKNKYSENSLQQKTLCNINIT